MKHEKFVSFLTSAILGVFIILGIVDDDFLRIEHVLSTITLLTLVLGITLSMIPDENYGKFLFYDKILEFFLVPRHAELLQLIANQVHYIPIDWLKDPRSARTQKLFSQVYQVVMM